MALSERSCPRVFEGDLGSWLTTWPQLIDISGTHVGSGRIISFVNTLYHCPESFLCAVDECFSTDEFASSFLALAPWM